MSEEAQQDAGPAKQRSPAFPYIPLNIAIDRIQAIFSKIRDFPQNREQIAKAYGKPATSSATIQTIATLQQYGLLEVIQVGSERRLRVSSLAKTIIHPNVPKDHLLSCIRKAALLPSIFKEIWDKFGALDNLSDDVPLYYLTHDREAEYGTAFTASAGHDVLRVYRATLSFAGIEGSDKNDGAEEAVDEWEEASPASQHRQPPQEVVMLEPRIETQAPTPPALPVFSAGANSRADTCNIPEGVVTLSFPEEFSQESLEDIEAWLDFQKNRLKRWVRAN